MRVSLAFSRQQREPLLFTPSSSRSSLLLSLDRNPDGSTCQCPVTNWIQGTLSHWLLAFDLFPYKPTHDMLLFRNLSSESFLRFFLLVNCDPTAHTTPQRQHGPTSFTRKTQVAATAATAAARAQGERISTFSTNSRDRCGRLDLFLNRLAFLD